MVVSVEEVPRSSWRAPNLRAFAVGREFKIPFVCNGAGSLRYSDGNFLANPRVGSMCLPPGYSWSGVERALPKVGLDLVETGSKCIPSPLLGLLNRFAACSFGQVSQIIKYMRP